MSTTTEEGALTKKDFVTPNDVRWCPGCGDYAILNAVQRTLPELGIPREKFVVVSGIGCSSRFPYYMNTYGFHTIHGRAPTVATGVKVANPDLSVWMSGRLGVWRRARPTLRCDLMGPWSPGDNQ